jgi:hypothetical protein
MKKNKFWSLELYEEFEYWYQGRTIHQWIEEAEHLNKLGLLNEEKIQKLRTAVSQSTPLKPNLVSLLHHTKGWWIFLLCLFLMEYFN